MIEKLYQLTWIKNTYKNVFILIRSVKLVQPTNSPKREKVKIEMIHLLINRKYLIAIL